MNTRALRLLLFVFGCTTIRLALVFAVRLTPARYLPYLGYPALLPACGFAYIFLSGCRSTGPEVFGGAIWWNSLRPLHAALYFVFAAMAIGERPEAYIPLLVDVTLGFLAFACYHLSAALA